ncbi:MAG TPA: hypothetical protein VM581_00830, partial [Magnetospirillaceae bacterium]|nr:hypothetical protein [Magnetospirillaceae bacterium]
MCSDCNYPALSGVWVAGMYDDIVMQLIHQYKFEHARAAYWPLATYITATLPFLDESWVVTAIPTIQSHIRARSFDHAKLLAQEVAQQKHVVFTEALLRKQNVQQVGSNRSERFEQTRL